jgi:hypothetical protein
MQGDIRILLQHASYERNTRCDAQANFFFFIRHKNENLELSMLHVTVFVLTILKMFKVGTFVAWKISCLYSSSAHTLLNKLRVNEVTAALIHSASPSKVVANGSMYTAYLKYHPLKIKGVRSGEQDGKMIDLPLHIHFPGNCQCRKLLTS